MRRARLAPRRPPTSEETARQAAYLRSTGARKSVGDGGQQVGDAGEQDLDRVEVLHRGGDEEAEDGEQEDADGGAEVGGVGAGEGEPDAEVGRVLVAGVGDPRGQPRLEEQQQAGAGDEEGDDRLEGVVGGGSSSAVPATAPSRVGTARRRKRPRCSPIRSA